MTNYQGYLLDLDGTTYFGKDRIPTAEAFICDLINQEIPLQFVTNNATRSPQEIATRLNQDYGIPAKEDMIYTSTIAMIDYLKLHDPQASLYVVGEAALKDQLVAAGYRLTQGQDADIVVQALDRQANYQSLAGAVSNILAGAKFYVTNQDTLIPTEAGMFPSSGALTAFIEYASGVSPMVIGKPNPLIIDGAVQRLGLENHQVLLIGDNYQTDIQAGIQAGVDTLMVLTGVSTKEDLAKFDAQPTYLRNDLSEWELSHD